MKRHELVDSLPAGLTRAVGRILSYHVGRENAIRKDELINQVRSSGYRNAKSLGRKVRVAVHELRNEGMLICSSSSGAGYWIAKDYTEAQEFIGEMKGRGTDILKTAGRMEKKANATFNERTIRMF